MSKFSLIALTSDKEDLLRLLANRGAVQIDDRTHMYEQEDWSQILTRVDNTDALAAKEQQLRSVKKAYELIGTYVKVKKGLFAPLREVQYFDDEQYKKALSLSGRLNDFEQELSVMRVDNNALRNKIAVLTPYLSYTLDLNYHGSATTNVFYGSVAQQLTDDQLQLLDKAGAFVKILSSDAQCTYLSVVCHKEFYEDTLNILKEWGFAKANFTEYESTVKDAIEYLDAMLQANQRRRVEVENAITGLAAQRELVETLYDKLTIERDRLQAEQRLVQTKEAFMLEGWVPTAVSEELSAELKKFSVHLDITPPTDDEDYPILLDNPALVKPYEVITAQYSLPKPRGFDPNKIMAPFYFMFFGMMLSDAGYGLMLSAMCYWALLTKKPRGMSKQMLELLGMCGISTIVWGIIFGSYFGDAFPWLTTLIVPLIDSVNQPMQLLFLSFFLGVIHLVVGLGCQGYILIKEGKPFSAIFDAGSWIAILIGIVLYMAGSGFAANMMGDKQPIINVGMVNIATYLLLGGAGIILLTAGRGEKGIFGKIMGGLGGLYGISGYVSDILSYSRLLALGLATGVIASVINQMGKMGGIVVYVIVFIFGHILNLGINALGAYVHSSRLQYVEFFGKFYEGGGKAFKPFNIKTKFVSFKEEK